MEDMNKNNGIDENISLNHSDATNIEQPDDYKKPYETSEFDDSSLPYEIIDEEVKSDNKSHDKKPFVDEKVDYEKREDGEYIVDSSDSMDNKGSTDDGEKGIDNSEKMQATTEESSTEQDYSGSSTETTKKNFDFMKFFRDRNIGMTQLLPIIIFAATLLFNWFSASGVLNNVSASAVSDKYANLFVPAKSTFSIWGKIYLLLTIYVVYTFVKLFKAEGEYRENILNISKVFVATSVLNILWIFTWHFDMIFLSFLVMIALFIGLFHINNIIKKSVKDMKMLDKVIFSVPFSLYFGWISIALVANFMAFLTSVSSSFSRAEFTSSMLIILSGLFTIFYIYKKQDIVYGLATVWGFAGLFIKHAAYVDGFAKEYLGIIILLSFVIFFSVATIVYTAYETFKNKFADNN